ncbi:hypothetical protein LCGC14_1310450 [marine sediment metagenome]|uniref:Uncharacterized protein n=1 Tax=marine sediment metagenome TaxID=412755 RepID=A0A0F9NQ11_9ZZZZ
MKSNIKTKIEILMILGIVFSILTISHDKPYFNVSVGEKSSIYNDFVKFDSENLKTSKVSQKFQIVGNSGWINFRNEGNCTGSGTYSDPYVIKNLVIDAEGILNGILIEDSDVFFKIENSTIYNAGDRFSSAGIKLINVTNGQLIDNNCSNNGGYGIYLTSSNNNTIMGNVVTNNYVRSGIILYDSSYNLISGNTLTSNSFGISILYYNSAYNTVSGNTLNNHTGAISIFFANYNDVLDNIVNNNTSYGISLNEGNYTEIKGNIASNNDYGIKIEDGVNNIISGNSVNYSRRGIGILRSEYNTISGNSVSFNSECAFHLDRADHNTISGNTVNNNSVGIDMYWDSDYNTISCNSFTGNDIDIGGSGVGNIISSCEDGGNIPGYNILFLLGTLSFIIVLFIRKMKQS